MILDECSESVVEMIGVTKRYRSTTALDDVSLTIPRGAILGLIGPNGAGKSTTIKILMGMLAPSAGVVRVLGSDVLADPSRVHRLVGYVPERHDMYPWMTAGEIIRFTSSFYETWDQGLCDECVDMFEIDRRKKVKHLSKGNRAKLGLLLAVSHRPALLILDEPTSGLDPIIHEDFLDGVLRTISHGETTVLFSSHDLGDIRRLADSVCILRGGKVLIRRGVDELLASAKRLRAVLADGHLPRWIPENTVWQRIERREWLLTVDACDPGLPDRFRTENPVESVDVFDVSLNDLFRDYILGTGVGR